MFTIVGAPAAADLCSMKTKDDAGCMLRDDVLKRNCTERGATHARLTHFLLSPVRIGYGELVYVCVCVNDGFVCKVFFWIKSRGAIAKISVTIENLKMITLFVRVVQKKNAKNAKGLYFTTLWFGRCGRVRSRLDERISLYIIVNDHLVATVIGDDDDDDSFLVYVRIYNYYTTLHASQCRIVKSHSRKQKNAHRFPIITINDSTYYSIYLPHSLTFNRKSQSELNTPAWWALPPPPLPNVRRAGPTTKWEWFGAIRECHTHTHTHETTFFHFFRAPRRVQSSARGKQKYVAVYVPSARPIARLVDCVSSIRRHTTYMYIYRCERFMCVYMLPIGCLSLV